MPLPTIIPVFTELLARHDLTRSDVILYGLIVATANASPKVTWPELEKAIGCDERGLARRLAVLRARGLLQSVGKTRMMRYVPIGPGVPANDNAEPPPPLRLVK